MNTSTISLANSTDTRSKSCDTVCSSNNSCFLKRRKPPNPLSTPIIRGNITRNNTKQRVVSAKILKLKSVQNKLHDANYHLAEVIKENQVLKTLQKRQDKALSKYEGANADLPRVLRTHEEDIRTLTEKNKNLKKTLKETQNQLKHKDDELMNMQEQLKYLDKLTKEKNLLERSKLTEQVNDLTDKLQKADQEIALLNRKLTLEVKNFKYRLNLETVKAKKCQKELDGALEKIENLNRQLELSERSRPVCRRFQNVRPNQMKSFTSLTNTNLTNSNNSELSTSQTPVTDVKLEPIYKNKFESQYNNNNNNNIPTIQEKCELLDDPMEKIKVRLSAESQKSKDDDLSSSYDKFNYSESDSSTNTTDKDYANPSAKLEKITKSLESTLKITDDSIIDDNHEKRLGKYCFQIVNSVKSCSDVIKNHEANLKTTKSDTNKLIESLERTKKMENKLKASHLLSFDALNSEDMDFVNELFGEEMFNKTKIEINDKNGDEDLQRNLEKRKLLATLRAIDNGESENSSFDEVFMNQN